MLKYGFHFTRKHRQIKHPLMNQFMIEVASKMFSDRNSYPLVLKYGNLYTSSREILRMTSMAVIIGVAFL